MLNDTLSTAISKIENYEKFGKKECHINPSSKVIKKVLEMLKQHKYIGDVEELSTARGGTLKVNLIGNINKCRVIKPRFSVQIDEFEKFEKRYLPAKGFGIIIISTSKGYMTHEEAKQNKIGGRLIAYCY